MIPPPSPDVQEGRWPLEYLITHGPRADPATGLTWFLLLVSVVVIAIFTVAVVWGALARRRPRGAADFDTGTVLPDGGGLAWIYAGVPLTVAVLVVALFWTMTALAAIDHPRMRPALTLDVTGRQWWWQVGYPAGDGVGAFSTANEIHIPAGRPVLVHLHGGDVIHSFWVPALTGKTDTIPGRDNVTWLQADHPGLYRGQCTEYCGLQHANMGVFVYADAPADFARWRAAQAQPAPAAAGLPAQGEAIAVAHCGMCHSIDGTAAHGMRGPNLTHVAGRRTLAAGTLVNTVNTLSGWVSDPQAQKPGALMPTTDLSGPQLHAVVAYLETLR